MTEILLLYLNFESTNSIIQNAVQRSTAFFNIRLSRHS